MKFLRGASLALLLTAQCAWAQSPIRLRARTIQPERRAAVSPPSAGAGGPVRHEHYILQFSSYPSAEVRRQLALRGVRVLSYVPDSALMVSSDSNVDLQGLGASWAGPLEARDKLSPLLAARSAPAYVVVFYPDVEMGRARALAQERGFSAVENSGLLRGHLVVTGDAARLGELAVSDEVSYILPASADLAAGRPVMGCEGALTDAGVVAEYATVGSGWAKDASGAVALQYFFESVTGKVNEAAAESEIERAFRTWASNANVSFTPGGDANSARTAAILFASGAHGDGYPFDGPGGVLAHAFYPVPPNSEPLAGDMHFDADESWNVGADVDIFSVALHEAGHALGLGHSSDPDAVMYPYYHMVSGLTSDDIAGIQSLYGPATAAPAVPTSGPPVPPAPAAPSGGKDATPPTLVVVSPASTIVSTSGPTISITGTASDNVGVTAVTWSTSTGSSGAASGAANWAAQAPLLVGTNVVTIRAYDAAGNSAWRSITVVRH